MRWDVLDGFVLYARRRRYGFNASRNREFSHTTPFASSQVCVCVLAWMTRPLRLHRKYWLNFRPFSGLAHPAAFRISVWQVRVKFQRLICCHRRLAGGSGGGNGDCCVSVTNWFRMQRVCGISSVFAARESLTRAAVIESSFERNEWRGIDTHSALHRAVKLTVNVLCTEWTNDARRNRSCRKRTHITRILLVVFERN